MPGLALQAHLVHPVRNQPLPSASTELVVVRLVSGAPGGLPAGLLVWAAFMRARGSGPALVPGVREWRAARWDAASSCAEVLVGPASPVRLEAGSWNVWLRADSPPEQAVRLCGQVQIV